MSFFETNVRTSSLGARQLSAVRRGLSLFGTMAVLGLVLAHQATLPVRPNQHSSSSIGPAALVRSEARLALN